MKKFGYYPTICLALVLLLTGTKALATSVAVFPVDDLSSGSQSRNQAMTEFVRRALSQRGLTVIRAEAVAAFMSARRIRQLGMLQTQEIMAARSDLQADLVLLGSLCQQSEVATALGMTLSLIRTMDGKTIWTSSKGVSQLDKQRLLGINAPHTMADIEAVLAMELFADWPRDLRTAAGAASGKVQAVGVEEVAALVVDSVMFTPKYVRPGEEVKCTIRFKVRKDSDMVKVFIRVGNRIHMATSEDGVYYQVTWVGSDVPVGTPLQVAMNGMDARIVNGLWSGGPQDADYPVSIIFEWPSGKREETYLGTYVVDSQAPAARFKLQGKKINGITAFRTELPITVLFKRSEPIVHWEFVIAGPRGEVVLQEKGNDQPPAQFVWRGQNSKNLRTDSGIYSITLKVWDRAQNVGVTTDQVQLLASAPALNLTLARQQERILAKLTAQDQVAIAYWRMELWSPDNTMLQTFEGQSLPAQVLLPSFPKTVDQQRIACVLQVRDSLGSKATRKLEHLLAQGVIVSQGPADLPGKENRDDADAWQADF